MPPNHVISYGSTLQLKARRAAEHSNSLNIGRCDSAGAARAGTIDDRDIDLPGFALAVPRLLAAKGAVRSAVPMRGAWAPSAACRDSDD